jgi:predicted transcriptional regulator of viral defense system
MNWATVLAEEARKNSILQLDDLARRYNLHESVARNALRRYEARGFVEHISNKVYVNKLNQHFSTGDLVNVLRPESYISLEWVLAERGITSQSPAILTCVTTEYPKVFRSTSLTIVYRRIAKNLFWGFEEKATRYNKYRIAEPEKALLDWIYLNRQEGLPTAFDELNLHFLNSQKLRQYAEKFPRTVNEVVKELLLDRTLAAYDTRKADVSQESR